MEAHIHVWYIKMYLNCENPTIINTNTNTTISIVFFSLDTHLWPALSRRYVPPPAP